LLTGTRVFHFGYRPRSIVGSGYSRSISAGGSWRPYLLVFRVWLIRSLTPPKTELPATIANRRPKVEKYRGKWPLNRGVVTWHTLTFEKKRKQKDRGGCALSGTDMEKPYEPKCGQGKTKIDLFRDFLQKSPMSKL
jgi:hypothetical protein